MELMECIVGQIQVTKNHLRILEQAFCRLNVVLSAGRTIRRRSHDGAYSMSFRLQQWKAL
jgi:hypothetical protein